MVMDLSPMHTMSKSSSGIFGVSGSSGSRGADGDDGGKDSPGPGGGSVLEEAPLPSFDSTSDEELSPELPSSICPPASEDDVPLGPGGLRLPPPGCCALPFPPSNASSSAALHDGICEKATTRPPKRSITRRQRVSTFALQLIAYMLLGVRLMPSPWRWKGPAAGEKMPSSLMTLSRAWPACLCRRNSMPRPNAAKKSTNDPKMTGRCTTPMLMIPASCSTATTMNAATTMLIHVQMGNIPRSRSITFATCAWA
mmetsp:Transcript_4029/g.11431  ORF Transcript_4029/g.11431 Transcript_4029/m.11431 type:complete len:254 (-) Transcript_4029:134-895(-)